ncbi:MAG TPA: HEAT repeat domain-containing protein [Kofleriaceae bacterium]|nr:HEAT repeat domain-containing protein [Kofleriaceae bacterium]
MSRALAVLTACLLLSAGSARADQIDQNVKELATGRPSKVRLAATLSLSKSKDPRAVLAVSGALEKDDDPTIRRVAALALEKMIDQSTAADARELALDALERTSRSDGDAKVKATAASTLRALSGLRKSKTSSSSSTSSGSANSKPSVFVNIDPAIDQSKKAPKDAPDRVVKIVRKSIESKTGYATSWPGGLPTSKDLSSNKSQAYIVASTVKKIEVTKGPRQATIACTVAIRVAPWGGKDGGEKWEANRAASASGSAKAMTGNSDRDISSGMRDCLEAVAEDVANRQVVPFIKRLATNP